MPSDPREYSEAYRSVDGDRLSLHLVVPRGDQVRAGVILFHGGGWITGSPEQFLPQCRALADTGILSASAEYRLIGSGASSLGDCLDDARAAIEHFRAVATSLGVEPARVAAGGGSAGAHLALASELLRARETEHRGAVGISEEGASARTEEGVLARTEEGAVTRTEGASARTDDRQRLGGLVLWNPAVDLISSGSGLAESLLSGLGLATDDLAALSPGNIVSPGCPPVLMFHGVDDEIVPVETVRRFRDAMVTVGNRCALVEFEGVGHGFFNYQPNGNPFFDETVALAARFLIGLP